MRARINRGLDDMNHSKVVLGSPMVLNRLILEFGDPKVNHPEVMCK